MSNEELDLVLCTMDDVIIEQSCVESISLASEVAAGMQGKHPMVQIKFVDEVEKTKKKLIMGDNSKRRMCNIDGQSFCPFIQGLVLEILVPPVSSQMIQLVFMMQSQSMSKLRLQMGG